MINLVRTNAGNPDFIALVKQLDAELSVIDGDDHAFYDQFNKISAIKYALVAYQGNVPVSCGAIKEIEAGTVEVKRMFTIQAERGKGFAGLLLSELESWAGELKYNRCVLETGKRQADAIALYKKHGYSIIPNYGQYAGVENSVCFEKVL